MEMEEVGHLIKSAELAKQLGIQPQTLRKWRSRGIGPRHIRLGGASRWARVVYEAAEVERWIESRRCGADPSLASDEWGQDSQNGQSVPKEEGVESHDDN